MLKFEADKLFEDFPIMFCPDFVEGHQTFKSWNEFMNNMAYHITVSTRPLYVHSANIDAESNTVFVDMSQFIVVPWDELENYI